MISVNWFYAVRVFLATALFALCNGVALADFPQRPIRLIVPYTPGGATDTLARELAAGMGKELGQSVIVENRPGANARVGAMAVARSAADGYTLFLASSASMVLNPLLYRQLGYAADDFRVLGIVAEAPLVVVTNAQVPAQNLQAFAAYAKTRAGGIHYASVGLGNPLQLATEMLGSELQIEMTHVPYKGSVPALTALIANDTQLMIDIVSTSLPHIRAGKLRALAVTGSERLKDLPETPTVAEAAAPGFRAATWFGVAVLADTPPAVIARLQAAVHKASLEDAFRGLLEQRSLLPQLPRSDAELRDYIARDRSAYHKVIQAYNIVLEDAGG